MKKILLTFVCILISLIMVGCSSTSDTKALNDLKNQIEKTESVVSSTSSSEVSEVSPKTTYYVGENQINEFRYRAYNDMVNEENLRQEILSLSAYLKDSQSNNKYKLAKKATSSLNELTCNLEKYTKQLNNTKQKVKSSVNRIKKYTNINTVSPYQALSGYLTLSNTMNERTAYMTNILSTLDEINILLSNSIIVDKNKQSDSSNNKQNNNSQNLQNDITSQYNANNKNTMNKDYEIIGNNPVENKNLGNTNLENNENDNNFQQNNINKPYKPFFKKNIDTYNPYGKNNVNNLNNTEIQNENTNYSNSDNNYNYLNGNNVNNYNYRSHRYNRINPNRNTDTYRPTYTNIDTYRYYSNRFNNNVVAPVSYNEKELSRENLKNSENVGGHKEIQNNVITTNPIVDEKMKTKENKNEKEDTVLTFNLLEPFHKGRKIDKENLNKREIEDKFGKMKEIVFIINKG